MTGQYERRRGLTMMVKPAEPHAAASRLAKVMQPVKRLVRLAQQR